MLKKDCQQSFNLNFPASCEPSFGGQYQQLGKSAAALGRSLRE